MSALTIWARIASEFNKVRDEDAQTNNKIDALDDGRSFALEYQNKKVEPS